MFKKMFIMAALMAPVAAQASALSDKEYGDTHGYRRYSTPSPQKSPERANSPAPAAANTSEKK